MLIARTHVAMLDFFTSPPSNFGDLASPDSGVSQDFHFGAPGWPTLYTPNRLWMMKMLTVVISAITGQYGLTKQS
jgi:hypothetical protein